MCGISGIVVTDATGRVDPDAVRRMGKALRHRGPDADGQHIDGAVGLAHTRLSIIDLSDAGRQPMTNEDGRYWIVFNDLLVVYGQNLCKPISPFCSKCKISRYCKRVGVRTQR